MSSNAQPDATIRIATAGDAPAFGQICYDAFSAISKAQGFPCDVPVPDAGISLLAMMFSTPGFYSVGRNVPAGPSAATSSRKDL